MKYTKKQIEKAVAAAVAGVCGRVEGLGASDAVAAAPLLAEEIMARLEEQGKDSEKKPDRLSEKGMNAAVSYLKRRGLAMEELCEGSRGPVDIVATDLNDDLVFVKVRIGMSGDTEAFEEVKGSKDLRKNVEKAMLGYLKDNDVPGNTTLRFDIVDLTVIENDRAFVRHYPNALNLCD